MRNAISEKILLLLFSTLIFSSCKSDNPAGPQTTSVTSGTIAVVTRGSGSTTGFSFAKGDTITMPTSLNTWADFEFSHQTGESGPQLIGVILVATEPTFHFVRLFSTIDSANTFFHNLALVSDSTFDRLAVNLKPYKIFTIKTRDNKFAKILIRSDVVSPDSTYATLTFDWVYQSNGTRQFY